MKRLVAFFRPVMRDDVIAALHKIDDFPGASMSEIMGVRRGVHQRLHQHREELTLDFPRYIRLEIVCSDAMMPILTETIRSSAHTGRPGDGKIFISQVDSAQRIGENPDRVEEL